MLRGLTLGVDPQHHRPHADPRHPRRAADDSWLVALFAGHVFQGAYPLARRGRLDRHAPGRPAQRAGHSGVDPLVDRAHRRRRPGCCPAPASATGSSPAGGDAECGAQCRRAGRPGEDHPVHPDRLAATLFATIQVLDRRLGRHAARHPEGVRGDHRRRHRRLPAHRRLRLGDRRHVRRLDLRPRADGHLLHRHRHRLVQGVPRRHDADRRAVQQLRPRKAHGRRA